jgi:hypothetical protein
MALGVVGELLPSTDGRFGNCESAAPAPKHASAPATIKADLSARLPRWTGAGGDPRALVRADALFGVPPYSG